ncbi:MAG: hypothetical protein HOJ88_12170 [Proteobacteria bacterium]|jgi:hypothetical protein|nr:hypothetical protein [Pseudomonadota bacterium]
MKVPISDAIEKQLAHVDGSTRGVYNKAELIEERKKIMADWGAYLQSLFNNIDLLSK